MENEKWKEHKIIPTDRYYILMKNEIGCDYVIADAVLILKREEDDEVFYKAIGMNFGMMNYYEDYWWDTTFNDAIEDCLDLENFQKMVEYKEKVERFTREEAIESIKNDFIKTRVSIDKEVLEIFNKF